jgi:hypothetical protein
MNFRKADWAAYVRETEAEFRRIPLPTYCGAGEKVFRGVLLTALKHAIPAGFRRDFVPGLSRETVELIHERDSLRSTDPHDAGIEVMNQEIARLIAQNKRDIWREKVKAAHDHAEPSRFWNLLRGLSGKKAHVPSNQPISFDPDSCSNPKVNADKFLKQYVLAPRSDPMNQKVLRRLHLNHPIDHSYTPFTSAQTLEAINHASSSTAKGPDGLTSIHLKHLGPAGIAYLTAVYNLSVRDAVIPAI